MAIDQRFDADAIQALSCQRHLDLLALPGAILRGRQVLQLAAAAGAEMGARRLGAGRRRDPLDRRPDQIIATTADDPYVQPIARHGERDEQPGGAELRDAVAPRADALDRHLGVLSGAPGHRSASLLRLDTQQAQAFARRRIHHGKELRARPVGAEHDETPAIHHDLIDAGAGGQAQCLRIPLHDRTVIARARHDQHREQNRARDQGDTAGDHKGLEDARDVVHASRRSCAAS